MNVQEDFSPLRDHNRVEWWVVDEDGNEKDHGVTSNLVVASSRTLAADLFRIDPTTTGLKVLAIGTNDDTSIPSTDPNNPQAVQTVDTKLNNEVGASGNPIGRVVLPVAETDTATAKNTLSGTTVTLRQIIANSTGGNVTVREIALFGDIPTISNPTAAPAVVKTTGGSLNTATYECAYTYSNDAGETIISQNTAVTTDGTNNAITVTASGSIPTTATTFNVYADEASGGTFYLQGSVAGSNTYTFNTYSTATAAPANNLTLTTGKYESGTLFNRAFVGPATLTSSDSIIIEVQISFG